jgi:hypothetical protein
MKNANKIFHNIFKGGLVIYTIGTLPSQTPHYTTLHYDISTLLAISHCHIGADVDFARSTASLANL